MLTVHENLIGVQERRAISTRDEYEGGGVDLSILVGFDLLLENDTGLLLENGTNLLLENSP